MTLGARARGWGDPDSPGYRTKHVVKITAGGRDLWVRREVAHLFKGFVDEIVARGYRIDLGGVDDWGYANRDIRGRPGVKSNHSWGLAIDLNARTNPMGPKLITDMPTWVVDAAERWGLLWGGSYKSRPDAMHFEFVGRPEDVRRYPMPPLDEEDDDMAAWSEHDSENLAAVRKALEQMNHHVSGKAEDGSRLARLVRAAEGVRDAAAAIKAKLVGG